MTARTKPGRSASSTTFRRGASLTAALATGLVAAVVPMAGTAQAATGDKSYDCGKAYSVISRADWTAKFDITKPTAAYVNQQYPLALTGSQVIMHSNETSWPLGGGSVTGNLRVPMSFAGVPVEFTGAMNTQYSFGANATIPANATASWKAPATPQTVAVTMSNFIWATNRNGGYTYNCNGTSNPKPYAVESIVVKSASRLTTDLPATLRVYRGDVRAVNANVELDGGAVAGTTKITVGTDEGVTSQAISSTSTNASNQLTLPTDLAPGTYSVKTEFVPTDAVHYDASSKTTELEVLPAENTQSTLTPPALVFSDDTSAQVRVKVTGPADVQAGKPAGKATLTVDGTALPQETINAAGEATFTLPQLSVGDHTLLGGFVPTNAHQFAASTTGPQTLSVKAPAAHTTTSLSLEAAEIQSTSKALAHLEVNAAGVLARGSVELSVNGQTITKELVNGKVDIELPSLAADLTDADGDGSFDKPYVITARYISGDPLAFRNSTATPVTLMVLPPAAATTTTVNLARSVVAPNEANQAEVLVQGGSGSPVGTVKLEVNGVPFTAPLANGRVSITLPGNLTPGEYPVRASFVTANPNRFKNSQSQATRFVVQAPAAVTTTSLQVSRQAILEGDSVVASARVDGSGVPAGTVQFTVNGSAAGLAPVAVSGSGTASLAIPSAQLPAQGDYVIGAVFTPTSHHLASTAAGVSVQVAQVPNQASVVLTTPAPVAAGAKATVSARVSLLRGTPAGEVTFHAGGQSVTVPVGADGTVTAELPALAIGTYQVSALYHGNDLTAIADPMTLTVTGAHLPPAAAAVATTTKVTLASASVPTGRSTTATATVTGGATGFVTFQVAGRSFTVLVQNGVARVALPELPVGAHQVSAQFAPMDAVRFKASSGTAKVTVTKAATRVVLTTKALGRGLLSVQAVVTATTPMRHSGRVTITVTPPKKLKKKVKAKTVTRTVDGSGVTQLQVKHLKKGAYTVTVKYLGSTQANASAVTKKAKVK